MTVAAPAPQRIVPPVLPAPFTACRATVHDRSDSPPGAMTLAELLRSPALERGFDGIMSRWGPGDRRAAASLWSQGCFARFLRPYLAYGLLHGLWFSTDPDEIAVTLSDLSTPATFGVASAADMNVPARIHGLMEGHIEPLIARLCAVGGGASRLHWSNAATTMHRALLECRFIAATHRQASIASRVDDVARTLADDRRNLGRFVEIRDDATAGPRLVRKLCCLRLRLRGLDRCKLSCPLAEDRAADGP
jgi:ferric iron reductase protein FhuF